MHAKTQDLLLLQQWVDRKDAEAFHELARRHAAMVYATARRVLQDAVEAEDVAQECFETLLKAERAPATHLPAWLHRVAVNRSISRLRKRGRTWADPSALDTLPAPLECAERVELHRLVDECLEELPAPLRIVLVEHFLQARTHEDIARSAGVDRSTISKRIQKALEELREHLRARKVAIPAAALGAFLAKESSAATPASLTASLGRLAISTAAPHATASLISLLSPATLLAGAGVVIISSVAAILFALSFPRVEQRQLPAKALVRSEVPSGTAPAPENTVTAERLLHAATPAPAPTDTDRSPSLSAVAVGRSISGHVVNVSTGGPVAGAEVVAQASGPITQPYSAETLTGPDGAFLLSPLTPGTYEVKFPDLRITKLPGKKNEL